jgi:hypothetical protein
VLGLGYLAHNTLTPDPSPRGRGERRGVEQTAAVGRHVQKPIALVHRPEELVEQKEQPIQQGEGHLEDIGQFRRR